MTVKKDIPILLILDNHNSHISLNSCNYCKENGIVMLSLVPHTSHRLQPLDVCFFGPFKASYRKECDKFLKKEALKKISHDDQAEIVNKAYCKVASIEKGVSVFKTTGIYPLNRRVFSKQDFVAADALLQTEAAERHQQEINTTVGSCIYPALEMPKQIENVINVEELPILILNSNIEQESTDWINITTNDVDVECINNIEIDNSNYISPVRSNMPVVENDTILNNTNKVPSEPANEAVVMPLTNTANKLPIFSLQTQKISKSLPTRRSRRQKSVILTSSPLHKQLEEKERKRKANLEKLKSKENIFKCKKIKQEKKDATTQEERISIKNKIRKKKASKTDDDEVSKPKRKKK